jgi:hypothetical protein
MMAQIGGFTGFLPPPDVVGQFMRGVAVVGVGVAGMFAAAAGVVFSAPVISTGAVVLGAVVAVGILTSAINNGNVSYNAVASAATGLRTIGQSAAYSHRVTSGFNSPGPPKNPCDDIEKYGRKETDVNNHHGIFDAWAKKNIAGYESRTYSDPTVRMSEAQHNAAHQAGRDWLRARGLSERRVSELSELQIFELAEFMFDAAGISYEVRDAYYDTFFEHIESGAWKCK